MSRSDDLDRTPARHPPRMAVGTSQRPPKPSTSVLTISPRGSARRLRASANRDPIFTSLTTVKHHTPTCDAPRPCSVLCCIRTTAAGGGASADERAQTGRRFAELSTSRRWAERTRSRRMIVSLLLVTGLKRTQNKHKTARLTRHVPSSSMGAAIEVGAAVAASSAACPAGSRADLLA